jgi:hypothetical protein
MNIHRASVRSGFRPVALALSTTLCAAAAMGMPSLATAADPSAQPSTVPVASPSTTMCQSAADLRLIIGFLQDNSIEEDGLVPELVGAVAALSEARTLLGLVDETYRPLAGDLVAALQDLRTTIDGLSTQETLGAGVAAVGESITQIGLAMDALAVELREPCPELEDASAG